MVAASPVDYRANPSDPTSYYVLWGNGRIDSYGSAVPITGQATWYGSAITMPVAVALHITNWLTGAGYILDLYGATHEFNGAPDLGGGTGLISGVPYTPAKRTYVDWSWDTSGSGQGYVLDVYGKLYPFGGATAPSRSGPMWSQPFARKLKMQWTPDKRAIIMDLYGGLHRDFALASFSGGTGAYWPRFDAARDFDVVNWTTPTGYKLDLYGAVHGFGGLANPTGSPTRKGADVARILDIVSASNPLQFREVWSLGEVKEFVSSTPPTVVAGGGVNEVHSVAVTGAPTAGTWSYTVNGQTASALSRTITASALQTALEALSNVAPGDVVVTGGPAGTAALTVSWQGALAATDITASVAHTFTGGTSPTVTLTTVTQGIANSPTSTVTTTTRPTLSWSYADSQNDSQMEFRVLAFTQAFVNAHTMTNPETWAASALVAVSGNDQAQRGVKGTYDFPNGTYRFYVRAKDRAGQWSAWSNFGWTQAITPPATPTSLTATSVAGTGYVHLQVTATTGGSADSIQFQWSANGTDWYPVRGAEAVPIATTTTADDLDAPLGVALVYRAFSFNDDPRVVSAFSNTDTETLLPRVHMMTTTADRTLGGEVYVIDAPTADEDVEAGVLRPAGDKYPIVINDGLPKARTMPITLGIDTKAEWDKIYNTIKGNQAADGYIVWRDPFGDVVYCRMIGSISRKQRRRLPNATEPYPLRHNHTLSFTLQEVKPPYLSDTEGNEAPDPND